MTIFEIHHLMINELLKVQFVDSKKQSKNDSKKKTRFVFTVISSCKFSHEFFNISFRNRDSSNDLCAI
jgi:hypothetical protein